MYILEYGVDLAITFIGLPHIFANCKKSISNLDNNKSSSLVLSKREVSFVGFGYKLLFVLTQKKSLLLLMPIIVIYEQNEVI